jgi:tape measure domain-containing protein
MAASFRDLVVRVGADVSGFRDAFRDATEALERAGDRATRAGGAINRAFDQLGVSDASAKVAAQAKSIQSSFELLEKAYKDGKITAEDFAKAQESVRLQLENLGKSAGPVVDHAKRISEAMKGIGVDKTKFQIDAETSRLKANLDILEKEFAEGRISADDFAKAQAHVRTSLQQLDGAVPVSTFEKLKSNLGNIGSSMRDLGLGLTASVTAPIVGLATAAIKSASDLQSLEIGLKAVTKEAGPLQGQLARLQEVAKLPGLGFKEAVQGSINLQAAGFSATTAERALSAFGNALATVGKGRDDLSGVITALSQIASKGKVSAEEINQLAERLPQVRVAIKAAFGEGLIDAKDFEKAGITSQEFVDKLIREFEKLPKATGGFRNEMENMKDAAEQTLAALGRILLPVAESVVKAMQPMAAFAKDAAEQFAKLPAPVQLAAGGFVALVAAIGPLVGGAGLLAGAANSVITLQKSLHDAGGALNLFSGVASGVAVPAMAALAAVVVGFTVAELVKGISDVSTTLKQVSDVSREAAPALTEVQKAGIEVSGVFASIAKGASDLSDVVSNNFWQALWPPEAIRRGFQELDFSIKVLANRFPEVETAAKKAFTGVADAMRKQAEAAGGYGIDKQVEKNVDAIKKQHLANIQELDSAQKTLKSLKDMRASKEEIATATIKVTEAQRKLHPELTATGDRAGKLGKSLDDVANIARKMDVSREMKLAKLDADLEKATAQFDKFKDSVESGKFGNQLDPLAKSIDKIITEFELGKIKSKEFADSLAALTASYVQMTGAFKLTESLDRLGVQSEGALRRQSDAAKEAYQAILQQTDASGRLLATKQELAQAEIAHLNALKNTRIANGESYGELDARIKSIKESLKDANAALQDAGVSNERLGDKVESLAHDYELVSEAVRNGTADHVQALQVRQKLIEAEIALARSRGESTKDLESDLGKINEELDKQGVKVQGTGEKWKDFGRQVSTIMTDLSKDIADAFIGIFKGNPENDRLRGEAEELRASLAERKTEWEKYQQNAVAQLEIIRQKHAEDLAEQEAELATALANEQAEYEAHVVAVNAQIEQIRTDHERELTEETAELHLELGRREGEYQDFQREVQRQREEARDNNARQLADELQDLRANLAEKQEAYNDFVEDSQQALSRLQEDFTDDTGDEKRSLDRKTADKRKSLKREEEDTERKIQNELKKGAKANREQIEDWRRTLERKREDTEESIRREEEDYADFVAERRRRLDQQVADNREALERRARDHQQYLASVTAKEAEIRLKYAERLAQEEADLDRSLANRTADLERYRRDVQGKIDDLTARHAAAMAREVADLTAGLEEKRQAWEKYKTDIAAKLEEIRAAGRIKLEADEAQLAADLAEASAEWDKYQRDTAAKLSEIESQFTDVWDRVGDAFKQTLESMGEALVRFGTEYLTGKLFKILRDELLNDLLDKIGKKLASLFTQSDRVIAVITGRRSGISGSGETDSEGNQLPGGGDGDFGGEVSGRAGGAIEEIDRTGQNLSSSMGKLAKSIDLIASIVDAAASVVTAIYSIRMEGTLNQIERNTAAASIHLINILENANTYWPKLKELKDYFTIDFNGGFVDLLSVTKEIRDMIKGDMASVLGKASQMTVDQDGNAIPVQVAVAGTGDESLGALVDRFGNELLGTSRAISAQVGQLIDPWTMQIHGMVRELTILPWRAALDKMASTRPATFILEINSREFARAMVDDISTEQAFRLKVSGQAVY